MPAGDRPLDARQENDPPFPGIRRVGRRIEVAIVERHRERPVAQRRRVIDELSSGVVNPIGRVAVGVGVQLDFQHETAGQPQARKKGRHAGAMRAPSYARRVSSPAFFPAIASACWRIVGSVVPTFNTSPAILRASSRRPALKSAHASVSSVWMSRRPFASRSIRRTASSGRRA